MQSGAPNASPGTVATCPTSSRYLHWVSQLNSSYRNANNNHFQQQQGEFSMSADMYDRAVEPFLIGTCTPSMRDQFADDAMSNVCEQTDYLL